MSGTPSFGAISTGNLMADCERWCRENLPRRLPEPRRGTALRIVPAPAPAVAAVPARRGSFRPGPGWPGVPVARTGS